MAEVIGPILFLTYYAFGMGVGVALLREVEITAKYGDGILFLLFLMGFFWPAVFGYQAMRRFRHPKGQ